MPQSADTPAIELEHVAKTYGRKVRALRGIGLSVRRGEVFGLLGRNGAGKSTLVKILMTVVRPTRAKGTVLGRPLGHKPTLARVGYLPENHRMPGYLTARQVLEYFAALAKVERSARRRRSGELLELVRLADWADVRVGTFSKGMQQRLGLAQALMNDPELVVLDEPTDGLDPEGRRQTRLLLKQLREEGKTVFLNSHLLGEVEQVCDRVAILEAGQVVRGGTIDELTAGSRRYEIELADVPSESQATAVWNALQCEAEPAEGGSPGASPKQSRGTLPSGAMIELDGAVLRVGVGEPAAVQPILDALRSRELVIAAVRPVRQSLEDFFVETVAAVPADRKGDGP